MSRGLPLETLQYVLISPKMCLSSEWRMYALFNVLAELVTRVWWMQPLVWWMFPLLLILNWTFLLLSLWEGSYWCALCSSVVMIWVFYLLTANLFWGLGIFQQSWPLNLYNLSLFLPSSFPRAARSFPCLLLALCPLTLAPLGLRPLQLVGAHHGL